MTDIIMYCRREPARDNTPNKEDVVLFHDVGGRPSSIECGRYPWHYKDKPTRRNKWVNHNCNRYRIHWLDHMGKPE